MHPNPSHYGSETTKGGTQRLALTSFSCDVSGAQHIIWLAIVEAIRIRHCCTHWYAAMSSLVYSISQRRTARWQTRWIEMTCTRDVLKTSSMSQMEIIPPTHCVICTYVSKYFLWSYILLGYQVYYYCSRLLLWLQRIFRVNPSALYRNPGNLSVSCSLPGLKSTG